MMVDRKQLQIMIAKKDELLTNFFEKTFEDVDADKGYLSFVDSQEHLSILVQRGEYWHLPADRGVPGAAFKTGKTQIVEPSNKKYPFGNRGMGNRQVYSEIAVPLFLYEEVVGVLLFDSNREDRCFDEREKKFLETEWRKVEATLRE